MDFNWSDVAVCAVSFLVGAWILPWWIRREIRKAHRDPDRMCANALRLEAAINDLRSDSGMRRFQHLCRHVWGAAEYTPCAAEATCDRCRIVVRGHGATRKAAVAKLAKAKAAVTFH